jgi:acyl carrier protein
MTGLNSQEALRNWMIDRLCSALRLEKADIDPDTLFSHYALDSVDSVSLVMDLEEELGTELPPTLLWDYPTVSRCAMYLFGRLQENQSP